MSKFDEERKRLGLPVKGQSSIFAEERERLRSGGKTRFEEYQTQKKEPITAQPRTHAKGTTKKKDEPKKKSSKKSEPKKSKKDSNWYIDAHKWVDDTLVQPIEEKVTRLAVNIADGIGLNQVKKGIEDKGAPSFIKKAAEKPTTKTDKVIDTVGQIAGMAAPIGGAYKATSKVASGTYKAVTKGKDLGKKGKYIQDAIKGGMAGGSYGTAREGLDEILHPEDGTFKERVSRVGIETALGAVGDPVVRLAGAGIKAGAKKLNLRNPMNRFKEPGELLNAEERAQYEALYPKWQNGEFKGTKEESDLFNELMYRIYERNPSAKLDDFDTPDGMNNPKNLYEAHTVKADDYVPPSMDEIEAPSMAPEQPKPNIETPVNIPEPEIPKQAGERAFYNTVANSEKTTDDFAQKLADFDKTYTPMSNEEVVAYANDYIKNDIEKAYQFVKNAAKYDPRHIAVGHRLIDEFQKVGDIERALDVVERLAEQGTKAGQSIQAFSIYNRLSVEGQLLRAQRRVNQINENVGKLGKKVELTEDTVKNITHAADSIQKLTGQEDLAKDVIGIMDKIKKGETPTDAELKQVQTFVEDAKKFIGEPKTTPKVKKVKDARTRDKVVDFMSKREEASKKELQKILGRANSLPVDAVYHLSIVGASKVAKGTVKFADFSEQMVKEFGEQIRPYMEQIYSKAVETFNLQSESLTRKRLSEVEKLTNKALKDKALTDEDAQLIKDFARQVGAMSGDAKLEASMELQATLQALERPTFGQRVSTIQTIGQLLNPKTIVRNFLGNEMFYRMEQLSKLVATPIDVSLSVVFGTKRGIVFRSHNQGNYWRNWLTGAKAGWRGVNPEGLQTQYDLGAPAFKSKFNPLTYLEKALGASLRSFDYAGYKRAYNKTLGELATLRAQSEGLKGKELKKAVERYIQEADEVMINMADAYGKYVTFQDNTLLSTGLQKLKRGLNLGQDFGFGDLILKYPKTPGNLLTRAMEYSPLGALRSLYLIAAPYRKNVPFDSAEFSMSLSRAIIGTGGFSILGYYLADKGILTGNGHSDYEVKELERNSGKQPNSVNSTALERWVKGGFKDELAKTQIGDKFVSYDWAQPLSIAIALGAGVQKSVQEEGEVDLGKATVAGVKGAGNTLVESSVLSGVKKAFEFYPGQTVTDKVIDIAGDLPSSFVPTFSNQFRQANDNTARNTYDPDLMKTFQNRATNRVPELEKKLPAAYDTLGKKKEVYQNGGNSIFNVFLNPSFVRQYNPTPEAKFVLDFINESGEKTVAPRAAPKSITIDGKKVQLTGAEHSKLQKIMGEETRKGLEAVVPKLQGRDFETIRKELERVLRYAGEKGRQEIREGR